MSVALWRTASELQSRQWLWGAVATATTTAVVLYSYHYLGSLPHEKRKALVRPLTRPFTLFFSSAVSLIGFVVHMVDDLIDAVRDGRTKVWRQAMDALHSFLEESGLEKEFDATLNSSSFLPALMALTDLQNKTQGHRRVDLRQQSPEQSTQSQQANISNELPQLVTLGQHYMRFATAVYGPEMMASAQLALYDQVLGHISDTDHQQIAQHCLLDKDSNHTSSSPSPSYEIWCDYTRDPTNEQVSHAQHSLLVCDHVGKQVIWAIRGTFSLSGIVTDLAGFATDFCNGQAHNGMAQAAQETWETVWDDILREKLQTLPLEYDIAFTGHSLGAGVACLVTILAYYKRNQGQARALQGRKMHCYAMAPPPVFTPATAAPEAVSHTVAYIHQFDIVPSLSVDSIRRLMACLDRLCRVLSKHPLWQYAARRWKIGEPSQELVDAYDPPDASSSMRPISTAPMFVIPARTLVWLEKNGDTAGKESEWDASYLAHLLDPVLYADRILDLELPDGVVDHLIPAYETAFARVVL